MTFNIRYGSADDGENSWQYRKNILFDVIRDYNADIIGMQEVLKFQLDELLIELQNYNYVGVGRDDGKTSGEYSPILFSKERFIVDTTETFWFSNTPKIPGSKSWGNNITRICTWAKLFDKFSRRNIYVFNLHLDHQSKESRIKSANAVIEKIKELKITQPVILTGDFNCGEDEETIRTILNSGFIDSYRYLHTKTANEGTFNGFKGDDTGEKIDFIFVTNNFEILNSKIIKTNINGRYPSDHFPVTAIIKYSE
ncbi:endonuclease/exonuclease/phosphatase family protein [Rosettibacter firmus]|uniref:endonuclease/exonuclease/phosphatase family protein n=1 Tax=Rosettibacter firmus TaxID=3111522 RepID=UPI00336BF923